MPDNFWPIANSIAVFALGTIVTVYLRRASVIAAEAKEQEKWRKEVDKNMAVLLTQVSPLWAAVQSKIAKDLTHPHVQFKEMDELLRQLEAMEITDDGRERLHELLRERSTSQDPEVSDEERNSARLMIGIMEKVVAEAADPSPITEVVTVGTSDRESGKKEKVQA